MNDYFFCLTSIIARHYLERDYPPHDALAFASGLVRGDEENQ
jgi:hypothetical protein